MKIKYNNRYGCVVKCNVKRSKKKSNNIKNSYFPNIIHKNGKEIEYKNGSSNIILLINGYIIIDYKTFLIPDQDFSTIESVSLTTIIKSKGKTEPFICLINQDYISLTNSVKKNNYNNSKGVISTIYKSTNKLKPSVFPTQLMGNIYNYPKLNKEYGGTTITFDSDNVIIKIGSIKSKIPIGDLLFYKLNNQYIGFTNKRLNQKSGNVFAWNPNPKKLYGITYDESNAFFYGFNE